VSGVDGTLAALADPARRGVVELLTKGPRRAGELSASLQLAPPAMSRHLKVLRAAGLVTEQHPDEDARVRLYSLHPEPFEELRVWIQDVERFWTLQLDAFKKHAERTRRQTPRPPRSSRPSR